MEAGTHPMQQEGAASGAGGLGKTAARLHRQLPPRVKRRRSGGTHPLGHASPRITRACTWRCRRPSAPIRAGSPGSAHPRGTCGLRQDRRQRCSRRSWSSLQAAQGRVRQGCGCGVQCPPPACSRVAAEAVQRDSAGFRPARANSSRAPAMSCPQGRQPPALYRKLQLQVPMHHLRRRAGAGVAWHQAGGWPPGRDGPDAAEPAVQARLTGRPGSPGSPPCRPAVAHGAVGESRPGRDLLGLRARPSPASSPRSAAGRRAASMPAAGQAGHPAASRHTSPQQPHHTVGAPRAGAAHAPDGARHLRLQRGRVQGALEQGEGRSRPAARPGSTFSQAPTARWPPYHPTRPARPPTWSTMYQPGPQGLARSAVARLTCRQLAPGQTHMGGTYVEVCDASPPLEKGAA